MPAPITVSAAGYFLATRAGAPVGEATLRMKSAIKGKLSLGAQTWNITGDPSKKTLRGTKSGSVVQLKIVNRRHLEGTVDGDKFDLTRAVLRPIPAAEMAQSDAGPTGAIKTLMEATPDYQAEVGDSTTFWYAFGPVLYRGRLDGSARVLCIASDPGPTECLPFMRRTLVGDSGQKTQGFLAKLGLTRSYVLVNAFAVAMKPSQKTKGLKVLKTNVEIANARHSLYDALLTNSVQAIIAFGGPAHDAYDLWAASNSAVNAVPVFKLAHPSAVDRDGSGNDKALKQWTKAVTKLRGIVSPDPDGDPSSPNFGDFFTEVDYARIPRWDLPSAAPPYAGDDSWGRAATPRHNNCCARPSPDDSVSLTLTPAPGQGDFLRYKYRGGALVGAKNKKGRKVAVDEFGIPV
ncbi:MAG TPA: uracil-DNA glycosylase family protein [Gemmatimonadaceae bacterium]|nr:uracil-DNA glycosylase family protein [Gemmatimonadaceae bacterium]